jgi:hypothetical protein
MMLMLRILARIYILQTSSPPPPSRIRAMSYKRHPSLSQSPPGVLHETGSKVFRRLARIFSLG